MLTRFCSFLVLASTLPFVAILSAPSSWATESTRPNILFIAVDDLRPELGCYGKQHIHSPNIDRLAQSGVLFERAYCMVPTCGASRASLLTGIRPTKDRFVNYLTRAEKDAPGIATFNSHFRQHGYYTVSLGKIFHHKTDSADGWSEPAWRPRGASPYRRRENQVVHQRRQKEADRGRGPAWESADVPDSAYADGAIADRAVLDLRRLQTRDEPFMLAVGFLKPHLPFVAPRKYWDLYDHGAIELAANHYAPKDAPPSSIHNSGELRAYSGIPKTGPVSAETARMLIHGYYACISYTDAHVGRLLDELDSLGLAENTIVVLWGDHGWNLGEHTLWCKHSCYETSMQIPLIVRAPGIKGGQRRSGLTESIDLYPSLCELAGIAAPEHVEGQSFVGLMKNALTEWKTAAVGRFRRGDTIRTDRYRFTEYSNRDGVVNATMLYDHVMDQAEDVNVAASQTDTVGRLSAELRAVRAAE
jgi:arylsulfatase A-like enzyme